VTSARLDAIWRPPPGRRRGRRRDGRRPRLPQHGPHQLLRLGRLDRATRRWPKRAHEAAGC